MSHHLNTTQISGQSYSFQGDRVTLCAHVDFSEDSLSHASNWYLQLWAKTDDINDDTQGVKVAQIQIFPTSLQAFYRGESPVMLPAKNHDQYMMLALAEQPVNGATEIRKTAHFSKLERFYTPQINGDISLDWEDDSVHIQIDAITNPRDENNLSGSLNLELWDLPEKYTGGAWSGVQLAIAPLGVVAGGEQIKPCPIHVPASQPTDGRHLTLMLREWTSQGFVTRDYREFEDPYETNEELQLVTTSDEPISMWKRFLHLFS